MLYGIAHLVLEIDPLLWPPCVADADIIFLPFGFFLLSSVFFCPRLISAAADNFVGLYPRN